MNKMILFIKLDPQAMAVGWEGKKYPFSPIDGAFTNAAEIKAGIKLMLVRKEKPYVVFKWNPSCYWKIKMAASIENMCR